MSFKVGDTAGDYEFVAKVPSTDQTTVFEVFNRSEQRREILKVLPRELQQDSQRLERFMREVGIRSRLRHPNIATFYAATELDGELVMTTEFVDGVSLEFRLTEGPVELSEAAAIGEEVCRALEYAHEHQIVHREITPAHIYLLKGGVVKLTGFSLARQYADPRLTQPGTVVGPIHYMSPEQVKGASDLDGRSDVYSLGIVLYEMIAGSRPFDSHAQFDVIQAHVLKDPPPLRDFRDDLPEAFEQAVLTALEKDREDRYESMAAFRRALTSARVAAHSQEGVEKPVRVRDPIENLEEDESDPMELAEELFGGVLAGQASRTRVATQAEVSPQAVEDLAQRVAEADQGWRTRDKVMVAAVGLMMLVALVMAIRTFLAD